MVVKRFSGRTAEEALAMAKWEMGENAIVLSSGASRDRWWKVWESGFQVLVAADYPRHDGGAQSSIEESETDQNMSPDSVDKVSQSDDGASWQRMVDLLSGLDQRLERIEVGATRAGAKAGKGTKKGQEHNDAIYQALRGQHLPEQWSRQVSQDLIELGEHPLPDAVGKWAAARLSEITPIGGQTPCRVLFAGPTGSGKTTTIAKLAAHLRLVQGKTVTLVTTDTFRVAAAEQLKTYAQILDVPFHVALRPQDLPAILEGRSTDVVLIDTAGRSPYQALYMAELRTIGTLAAVDQVHVVLPATMEGSLMVETARRFGEGLPARLCFTKVDEAQAGGAALGAALSLRWPLSYITNGQHVPDDIHVADPMRLGQWVGKGQAYV